MFQFTTVGLIFPSRAASLLLPKRLRIKDKSADSYQDLQWCRWISLPDVRTYPLFLMTLADLGKISVIGVSIG